jgi:CheY-like chemotaxis protein
LQADQSLNILIVEDEPLIAMLAEEMVAELGHVPHVAASCEAAIRCMADHRIDLAILDFTLAGETSEEVAHSLREQQIPLAFTTGHGLKLSEMFEAEMVLPKPYTVDDFSGLVDALRDNLQGNRHRD